MNNKTKSQSKRKLKASQKEENLLNDQQIQLAISQISSFEQQFAEQMSQYKERIISSHSSKLELQDLIQTQQGQSKALEVKISKLKIKIQKTKVNLKKLQQNLCEIQSEKSKIDAQIKFNTNGLKEFQKQLDIDKEMPKILRNSLYRLSLHKKKQSQLSFSYPKNQNLELRRKVASQQFVVAIFDYFEDKKKNQMQILNRRFYNQLVPQWRAFYPIVRYQHSYFGVTTPRPWAKLQFLMKDFQKEQDFFKLEDSIITEIKYSSIWDDKISEYRLAHFSCKRKNGQISDGFNSITQNQQHFILQNQTTRQIKGVNIWGSTFQIRSLEFYDDQDNFLHKTQQNNRFGTRFFKKLDEFEFLTGFRAIRDKNGFMNHLEFEISKPEQ